MIWTDETLKLRPACSGAPLRVAVLLDEFTVPPWVAVAIRTLRTTPGIELCAAFRHSQPSPIASQSLAYRYYERWNLAPMPDGNPLLPVSLDNELEGIRLQPWPDHPRQWQDMALDVLVCLTRRRPSGDCSGVARYGVWSLHFASPGQPELEPRFFWEMQRGDIVTETVLYVHTGLFAEGRVIYRYQAATRRAWKYASNAVEPLSMAPVILTRRLLDVQQRGWDALTELPTWREGSFPCHCSVKPPGTVTLLLFLARRLAERIHGRIRRARGEAKWFVCLRSAPQLFTAVRDRFDGQGFLPVPNPPHSTFADPFLYRYNGRTYLFVEEIVTATSRGHISACEVFPGGGLSDFVEVMRRPFHLSYPCLVKWREGDYMIPETAENRTVELHRAENFPSSWKLVKTLLRDVLLVDTTPFQHEGVWYFFTATVEEVSGNWLETWLFYSDRLDGEWTYHPSNPICSDVRRARPAGNLFYRQGKLIRPAQDCSIRYGYALVFNEVLKLSPTCYEERPLEVIYPNWMEGILGTHTLNATEEFEVIDATRVPTA